MYTAYIVENDKASRELDDAAWLEELATIDSRMRFVEDGGTAGSTRRFNREECYDLWRMRLGPRLNEGDEQ